MGPVVLAGLLLSMVGGVFAWQFSGGAASEPSVLADVVSSDSKVEVLQAEAPSVVQTALPRRPIVALDPGHGGPDDDLPRANRAGRVLPRYREGDNSGAIFILDDGSELREKDLTLRLALATAELLEQKDVKVVLTRREDVDVNRANRDYNSDGKVDVADELLARVELVNRSGADLLVSIHLNAHPSQSMRGTYASYADGRPFSEQSVRLALSLHQRVLQALSDLDVSPIDRGVEDDAGDDPAGQHLILFGPRTARAPLETRVPGALIEPLFITNSEDAELLRREDVLTALAQAIADGILEYLGRL